MKKIIYLGVMCMLTLATLSGCGGASSSDTANGELNIFVWTEYIPESVVQDFEDETGIKVNVSTFSSNEDMLAKVKAESKGAFDIVQPSDYMVEQMIKQGLLAELDKETLTNISNLNETYLNPSYDPGNVYSVPYQGGVGAIAVNTAKVTTNISEYSDLFSEDLANSLVVLDDFRALIGMTSVSLGYDFNETDSTKLSEVEEKLMTLKENIKLYDSDSPKSALISGDCTVGFMWSAEAALAMDENPDIKVVYPSTGAYLFMDNWCVTKDAKNSDAAMKFINYMLDAKVMQSVSLEFPYLNPNKAAVELLGEEYTSNEAKNPPAEVIANGEYVSNLDQETLTKYDQMWTNLKQ